MKMLWKNKNVDKNLLKVLTLLDKLVGDIEVAVKIEACGFVMQVGTSLALVEQFQCFYRLNIKPLGQFHCNGTDAVTQDDFLNNR